MTAIDLYKGTPSPFWTFSLAVYGCEGVPPACLTLQDGSGADVNVLLFSLFLGRSGRALSVEDVARIAETIEPWRANIVAILRAARRALKEPPQPFEGPAVDHLRKNVKAAELESERIQQELLFVTFSAQNTGRAHPDLSTACALNIEACQAYLGSQFDTGAVRILLDAAARTDVKGMDH
jgi:uncharacterized protein (TIGR02444 family)